MTKKQSVTRRLISVVMGISLLITTVPANLYALAPKSTFSTDDALVGMRSGNGASTSSKDKDDEENVTDELIGAAKSDRRNMSDGKEASVANMIPPEIKLQPIDLDEEVRLSDMSGSDVEILRANSKGVMTIYEFLERHRSDLADAYALGRTSPLYYAASNIFGLQNWNKAFSEFGIKGLNERTIIEFLNKIVSSERPIVFFVPRDVKRDLGKYTSIEFNWFFSHPDSMHNVYFIFGLEELISTNDLLRLCDKNKRFLKESPSYFGDLIAKVYEYMLQHVDEYKLNGSAGYTPPGKPREDFQRRPPQTVLFTMLNGVLRDFMPMVNASLVAVVLKAYPSRDAAFVQRLYAVIQQSSGLSPVDKLQAFNRRYPGDSIENISTLAAEASELKKKLSKQVALSSVGKKLLEMFQSDLAYTISVDYPGDIKEAMQSNSSTLEAQSLLVDTVGRTQEAGYDKFSHVERVLQEHPDVKNVFLVFDAETEISQSRQIADRLMAQGKRVHVIGMAYPMSSGTAKEALSIALKQIGYAGRMDVNALSFADQSFQSLSEALARVGADTVLSGVPEDLSQIRVLHDMETGIEPLSTVKLRGEASPVTPLSHGAEESVDTQISAIHRPLPPFEPKAPKGTLVTAQIVVNKIMMAFPELELGKLNELASKDMLGFKALNTVYDKTEEKKQLKEALKVMMENLQVLKNIQENLGTRTLQEAFKRDFVDFAVTLERISKDDARFRAAVSHVLSIKTFLTKEQLQRRFIESPGMCAATLMQISNYDESFIKMCSEDEIGGKALSKSFMDSSGYFSSMVGNLMQCKDTYYPYLKKVMGVPVLRSIVTNNSMSFMNVLYAVVSKLNLSDKELEEASFEKLYEGFVARALDDKMLSQLNYVLSPFGSDIFESNMYIYDILGMCILAKPKLLSDVLKRIKKRKLDTKIIHPITAGIMRAAGDIKTVRKLLPASYYIPAKKFDETVLVIKAVALHEDPMGRNLYSDTAEGKKRRRKFMRKHESMDEYSNEPYLFEYLRAMGVTDMPQPVKQADGGYFYKVPVDQLKSYDQKGGFSADELYVTEDGHAVAFDDIQISEYIDYIDTLTDEKALSLLDALASRVIENGIAHIELLNIFHVLRTGRAYDLDFVPAGTLEDIEGSLNISNFRNTKSGLADFSLDHLMLSTVEGYTPWDLCKITRKQLFQWALFVAHRLQKEEQAGQQNRLISNNRFAKILERGFKSYYKKITRADFKQDFFDWDKLSVHILDGFRNKESRDDRPGEFHLGKWGGPLTIHGLVDASDMMGLFIANYVIENGVELIKPAASPADFEVQNKSEEEIGNAA